MLDASALRSLVRDVIGDQMRLDTARVMRDVSLTMVFADITIVPPPHCTPEDGGVGDITLTSSARIIQMSPEQAGSLIALRDLDRETLLSRLLTAVPWTVPDETRAALRTAMATPELQAVTMQRVRDVLVISDVYMETCVGATLENVDVVEQWASAVVERLVDILWRSQPPPPPTPVVEAKQPPPPPVVTVANASSSSSPSGPPSSPSGGWLIASVALVLFVVAVVLLLLRG